MSDFKTHVTVSTALGIGYTGIGAIKGLPIESAIVAGGLCGIAGMLPDIDSDTGIPLRETMGFAAAVAPMMMMDRFVEMGLNYEQIVLAGGTTYVFVRFVISRLIAKYTVHRGMFHSIPAILIFTGIAFLVSGSSNLQLRYFKAGGVMLGSLSHLMMDELNSIEWAGGRWRLKRSFGTALKLWGKNWWANFSAYSKLALVAVLILSEPAIMDRYGQLSPVVVDRDRIRDRLRDNRESLAQSLAKLRGRTTQDESLEGQPGPDGQPTVAGQSASTSPPALFSQPTLDGQLAERGLDQRGRRLPPSEPAPTLRRDRTIYDTAKRVMQRWFD